MRHNFNNLGIWKRSMILVTDVYKTTLSLPKDEKYGLTSQIKRSSVSIPSNIAEGCGRNSDRELKRFLDIAIGSSCELETQLLICENLSLLSSDQTTPLITEINEIRRMTLAIIKGLKY